MSNKRTILDYPRNEAGLVDEFIGTAFDTVKNVYDNLPEIQRLDDVLDQIDTLAQTTTQAALDAALPGFQSEIDTRLATAVDAVGIAGDSKLVEMDDRIAAAQVTLDAKVQSGQEILEATEAAAASVLVDTGRFLTPAATSPATRDDGTPLQLGDRYLNTTENREFIYKDTGWVQVDIDLNILKAPTGATLIGAGIRTQQEKNDDFASVRDSINATVDGTTDNHDGIVAAVFDAYTRGVPLLWPRGTYVRNPNRNIPYFHQVKHYGPGVLKSGDFTWVISGKAGNNFVHTSVTGSDDNDGLSPALPLLTVQATLDVLKAPYMGSFLTGSGTFRMQFAAGTWTEGGSFSGNLTTRNPVYIQGTLDTDGNTPATIIDGVASSKTAGIYMDGGPSNLYVRDIMSKNFRANPVASGFVFANKGITRIFCDNLYTNNNLWAGVNCDSIGQMNMIGGVHDANTNYQLRARGGVAISVGRSGERRIVLKNSTGASVQIRDCSSGHFDYVDIINHPTNPIGTGIWVANCSRLTFTSVTITNCNLGINSDTVSTFGIVSITFTNVNTRFRCNGNGVQDSDSDSAFIGGQGLRYDSFQDRYSLGEEIAPVAAFSATVYAEYTKKTTTADWARIVPAATVARLVHGNPTSNVFFRQDHDFANSRVQHVIQGTVAHRITTSNVDPGRDNTTELGHPSARWSVVRAATATISTSDERYKTEIQEIDAACLRAWAKVEYMQYKFKDAVEAKADGARWHFGVIAQRVEAAFASEGIDARDYGVLCYDEWSESPATYVIRQYGRIVSDTTGEVVVEDVEYQVTGNGYTWVCTREEEELDQPARPAGNRYGVRYEEALALECAYLRSLVVPK